MKKLRAFINRVLTPRSPGQPASSAFGAEAERSATSTRREKDLARAIAEEKGRTRRGTF